MRTRRPVLQVIRALTMLGMPACFVFALARLSVDATMSLFWSAPLLAMLLGSGWLGERVGVRQWLAAAAAYAGALVILGPFAIPTGRAAILPLLMRGCFALYLVLTRFMRDETTASRPFYTALGVWLPLGLVVPWVWKTPTLRDFGLMSSIGVLGFLFLLGLDHALDAAPVGRLAPFALAQPIWTVVIDAGLSGHAPARRAVVGIMVLLGAWLVFAWPERVPAMAHRMS